jgi:hypothetical protein
VVRTFVFGSIGLVKVRVVLYDAAQNS